jgi:hypothetical protein
MTARRLALAIVILLTALQFVMWAVGGIVLWVFREGVFGGAPPEMVTGSARVAVALALLGALNFAAVVGLSRDSRGWGWWLAVAAQFANLVPLAVSAQTAFRPLWFWLSAAAAVLSLALLVIGRRVHAARSMLQ